MSDVELELSYDEDGNISDVDVETNTEVTVTDLSTACQLVIRAIQEETNNLKVSDLEGFGGEQ